MYVSTLTCSCTPDNLAATHLTAEGIEEGIEEEEDGQVEVVEEDEA